MIQAAESFACRLAASGSRGLDSNRPRAAGAGRGGGWRAGGATLGWSADIDGLIPVTVLTSKAPRGFWELHGPVVLKRDAG